jgi:hypothetical protein
MRQQNLFNSGFKHQIDDNFISENTDPIINFYFIEVSDYDHKELKFIGNSIKEKIKDSTNNSDGVLVCYFYKDADKDELPEDQRKIIKKIYPNKPKLTEKLNFFRKAYIYTASTTDNSIIYKNNKISSGKLVRADIIIPKKGTNAYFILFGAD